MGLGPLPLTHALETSRINIQHGNGGGCLPLGPGGVHTLWADTPFADIPLGRHHLVTANEVGDTHTT